jgi:hypothetical protein
MTTVTRYLLLWPDKLSVVISILTELPNMLAEYPVTYKYCPCIRSAKTPVRPCISSTMTSITSFALQPSYSNSYHWFCYYHSCRLLRITATVARYPLLWPDKPSVTISIFTELPNTLAEYPSTYKCRSCIRSAKTSVCLCISPAMTPITSFVLQPSYSNPYH